MFQNQEELKMVDEASKVAEKVDKNIQKISDTSKKTSNTTQTSSKIIQNALRQQEQSTNKLAQAYNKLNTTVQNVFNKIKNTIKNSKPAQYIKESNLAQPFLNAAEKIRSTWQTKMQQVKNITSSLSSNLTPSFNRISNTASNTATRISNVFPNTKGKTLVADVSSCFLSEPVDVSKYGIIYGGVQKNIGPAGMVIVIIREDLITEDVLPGTPTMLTYKTQADAKSLYNTPPAYGIYICGKVFKWLKKQGGLEAMKERNEKKAKVLYDYLDSSKLFKGTVEPASRSLMNVPFVTGDKELDAKFVKEAEAAGFVNLKGHRTVGGMRASIYNAMPIEGVEALVEFMKKFEKENA